MTEIITPRLLLRSLEDEDAADLRLLRSDPDVNRYIERPNAFSLEESFAFIKKIRQGVKENKCFYWGICPLSGNGIKGTICIWNINENRSSAEIGYELLPSWQGRGLMNEAVPAVIRFCFDHTTISELWGVTHISNKASVRILEKNRFVFVPERKEENPDLQFYCLKKNGK